jgi:hypothetical protein
VCRELVTRYSDCVTVRDSARVLEIIVHTLVGDEQQTFFRQGPYSAGWQRIVTKNGILLSSSTNGEKQCSVPD